MAIRLLARALSFALFLLTLGAFVLPFCLFQSTRLVPEVGGQAFDNVETAKAVLSRFNPRRMDPEVETRVSVSADELEAAIGAVLSRTIPGASVEVDTQADGVRAAGTAALPGSISLLGKYLNVEVIVAPSSNGLVFSRVAFGSISVPTWLVRPVSTMLVDWVVGNGKGELAHNSVKSVSVEGSHVTVTLKPAAGLYDDFKDAARKIVHRDNVTAIRAYHDAIVDVSLQQHHAKSVSLSEYMTACARLATVRSKQADAAEENRAFILALALYFGDSRFALLLDDVLSGAKGDRGFDRDRVKLAGRHDWVQHFVTSAGLQVAAGSNISNFVGEAKEVVDTEGPSGFSFTDIAADRAGVRFAIAATMAESSAGRVQAGLSGIKSEAFFFPEVRDLPEGLSETEFKTDYQDVGSVPYNAAIAKIDARIGVLPIFKN